LQRNITGSEALAKDAKREADAIIKKACIEPLKKVAGKEVATATVSSESEANQSYILFIHTCIIVKSGYEYTLSNLAQLTFDLVKDKIAMEASVVTAIAQRVNSGIVIEGCIA
jgi:hypothetical protein